MSHVLGDGFCAKTVASLLYSHGFASVDLFFGGFCFCFAAGRKQRCALPMWKGMERETLSQQGSLKGTPKYSDTTIYKLQCSGVFHVRIPAQIRPWFGTVMGLLRTVLSVQLRPFKWDVCKTFY